jgi:hypothetical protein
VLRAEAPVASKSWQWAVFSTSMDQESNIEFEKKEGTDTYRIALPGSVKSYLAAEKCGYSYQYLYFRADDYNKYKENDLYTKFEESLIEELKREKFSLDRLF